MTISLLLVVMRILTVPTRSKLEILPISGAPAAQYVWGQHRLTLPAFIPALNHTPALQRLEMPPDLTLLLWQSRRKVSTSPQFLQEPSTQPCVWWGEPGGGGWRAWVRGAGGRRGEGHTGSDRTSKQAAISGEGPMLLV